MATITVQCPAGHRLRGQTALLGRTVRCPRCAAEFVFSDGKDSSRERESTKTRESTMSDTSIMRILGDSEPLPEPPETPVATTRPCPRCEQAVSNLAHVCEHCRCYIGPMPMFMQQMREPPSARQT